jgi:hypothetical protein
MYMCNDERGMEHSVVTDLYLYSHCLLLRCPAIYTSPFNNGRLNYSTENGAMLCICYSNISSHIARLLHIILHNWSPPRRRLLLTETKYRFTHTPHTISALQAIAASVLHSLSCAPVTRDSGATSKELLGAYQKYPSQHPGKGKSLPRLAHRKRIGQLFFFDTLEPFHDHTIRRTRCLFCSYCELYL